MKTTIAKYTRPVLITVVLLTAALVIARCGSTPMLSNYSTSYQQALTQYPASYASDTLVEQFAAVYSDLKSPDLGAAVDNTYAVDLYFNDTFNTFTSRQQLKEYLLHTADNLRTSSVRVDDIARSGNDVYIRWQMAIELDVKGRKVASDSVGITHLRFNGEGQIVVHQDYWDGVEGFYQHLPYVGYWIRKLRDKL